jgi:hypothetical protein
MPLFAITPLLIFAIIAITPLIIDTDIIIYLRLLIIAMPPAG